MQQEYYAFPENNTLYSFGDNYATDAYHMTMRQMEYEKNMLAKQNAQVASARAEAAAATEAAKVERLVAKRLGARQARIGGTSHFTELEIVQLEKYFMVVIFMLVILVVVNIGTLVVMLGKVGKGGTMVIT